MMPTVIGMRSTNEVACPVCVATTKGIQPPMAMMIEIEARLTWPSSREKNRSTPGQNGDRAVGAKTRTPT